MLLIYNVWLYLFFLRFLYKSLVLFFKKNAFCLKLCLFFFSIFIMLNDNEISQSSLIISILVTSLVLIISLLSLIKEFNYFFFDNLTCFKFVFFILFNYFFFFGCSLSLFYITLQHDLDIFFLQFLLTRFSFFKKTILCYLFLILIIFLYDALKDKRKVSLSQFSQRFMQFLPLVFFFLLFLSFAFLTFSSNFFQIYFLALFLFFPEFKNFYNQTWTSQILNSSAIWHIFRFSSGIPFFIFEIFLSTDFALNGLIFLKVQNSLISSSGCLWSKSALYEASLPRVTVQKRWGYDIIKKAALLKPIESLMYETIKPYPSIFNLEKKHVGQLKISKLFSNSEIFNLKGHELSQSILLKRILTQSALFMPADFVFLNETTFLLHPESTWNKDPYAISLEFCEPREAGFSFAAKDSRGKWYFFTKIANEITGIQALNKDLSSLLDFIASNDHAWDDLSQSNGVLLTKAIQFKTHDLIKIDSNTLTPDFIIEEKAYYQLESRPSYGNSTNDIKLAYLDTRRGQLDLFDNLQGSKFLGYSNLNKEPIIPKEIKNLIEERRFLKHHFLNDHERATNLKVQVFTKIVKNYLETNKSK